MPTLRCNISHALEEAIAREGARTGESLDEIVIRALANELQVDHATLFQVSTAGALVEGVAEGAISVAELSQHGDFGLGTFAGFDGEMVVVDGTIYQVHGSGEVEVAADAQRVPFAVVTHFVPESTDDLGPIADLDTLLGALDAHRNTDNEFFAVRLDGAFEHIKTRAVGKVEAGATLVDVAESQAEFELSDVSGTLVGFWSPEYVRSVNVPGWHLHFLSEDRRAGGHLLDCRAAALRAQMQHLADFRMALPENEAFLAADLGGDKSREIEAAERER